MARLKILVAGDPGSIHANRFVALLQELGYDVRLFQSARHYWLEEHLHNTVVYVERFSSPPINGNTLKVLHPFEMGYRFCLSILHQGYDYLLKELRKVVTCRPRCDDLLKVLRGWRPDVVFSLKMQDDGYTVAAARAAMGKSFPAKWVHFSWGTDMEFFGKHPDYAQEHLPRIRNVLALCDYHLADTDRDIRQARDFGFQGIDLGSMVAHGGFDLEQMSALRQPEGRGRDVILVKGREGGLVGRAFNVLAALHRCQEQLRGYKIRVIMPTDNVRGATAFLRQLDSLDIEVCGRLTYEELLKLYGRSIMAISASDVDGTPSFLAEAMCMGALPVHSDMESVREWIDDGCNGLLFPVDDIDALCHCIERGIKDNELLVSAARLNEKIAGERMARDLLREKVRRMIEKIVLDSKGTG